jgi:N-hydroxyarylamine O-acetyltransferase
MAGIPEPYRRYLRLLGIKGAPSGLDGLEEIVCRHVCRVPFENVSKLLLIHRVGTGRATTLSEFLDGIEHLDLGGTCYTNNPFLTELLRALGYEADLLGADMSTPNIHTSIRVCIAGVDYHVDAGYGGPFLRPIRLDRLPHEIRHGADRYVFDRCRNPEGHEMAMYRGQERLHSYVVHGPPRQFEFFTETILDSYVPGRTFMSCLRIVRFFEDRSVELLNRTLTCTRGSETSQRELENLPELEAVMKDDFSMPRCPIKQAVEILQQITKKPLF